MKTPSSPLTQTTLICQFFIGSDPLSLAYLLFTIVTGNRKQPVLHSVHLNKKNRTATRKLKPLSDLLKIIPFSHFAYSPGHCPATGLPARPPDRAPDRKLRYLSLLPASLLLYLLASTWGEQPKPEEHAADGRLVPETKSRPHEKRAEVVPAAAA